MPKYKWALTAAWIGVLATCALAQDSVREAAVPAVNTPDTFLLPGGVESVGESLAYLEASASFGVSTPIDFRGTALQPDDASLETDWLGANLPLDEVMEGGVEGGGESDSWEFMIAPYVWIQSIDVLSKVNGSTTRTTLNFSEILDNLNGAGFVSFEARNGDWSLLADWAFGILEGDVGTCPAKSDVTVRLSVLETSGAYRFARLDLGDLFSTGEQSKLSFEAIGGTRYYWVEVEVDPDLIPTRVRQDVDWLTVLLGGRVTWDILDDLAAVVRTDIGGFNIGGADHSVNFMSTLRYKVSKSVSLGIGYRYLSTGYKPDGAVDTELGLRIKGMVMGAVFQF
jgi:hypothetical protein